jgi:hypothetical protein
MTHGRVDLPVYDATIERAILGSVFQEPDEALPLVLRTRPEHFLDEKNRLIRAAVDRVHAAGTPVDALTVNAELTARRELDAAGGAPYFAQLFQEGAIPAHVAGYIDNLLELWRKRRFVQLGKALALHASNGTSSPELVRVVTETLAEIGGVQSGPTSSYIEPIAGFLAEEDPAVNWIFPELLPCGVLMLKHGEPRARKSLAAFELALAAATGTAPFGLKRFQPSAPIDVLYIQEEDPRSLTRPRLRRLVRERCGDHPPATLHVAVRRGIDLDDPFWVTRIIDDCRCLDIRLLVLDAARRLSMKTDEGPAKVRELISELRRIVTAAGVTIIIVHHDIKPPVAGQDQRRRGQRASGGDWFAGCECPVHIERISEHESLVFPQDYKFSADPAPFTFTCALDGRLIKRLVGLDTSTENAELAGIRGKVVDWLRVNGPASKTMMQKAGLARWETLHPVLEALCREGKVDSAPGRQKGSLRYFVTSPTALPGGLDAVKDATTF